MRQMKKFLTFICLCLVIVVSPLADDSNAYELPPPNIPHTQKDVECLARNIYFESRGEGEKGMKSVAYTTLNRVKHNRFPASVCGVVKAKKKGTCQFSWVCSSEKKIRNREKYEEILALAVHILYTYSPDRDPTKGATHFHSVSVSPKWDFSKMRRTAKVGRHVFYREL